MAQFSTSTHKSHWLLSEAAARSRREAAHAAAVASCASRTSAPPLTLAEELLVLEHHERRVAHLARSCGLPEKVASSAVVYFKRFFVDRSVMAHNPSVVALQALYAASKVEEALISADDLIARADATLNGAGGSGGSDGPSADGTAARVRVDAVLNGELDFLQALRFHLVVFHPYRSLRVACARLRAALPDAAARAKLLNRATELCATRALHSDLALALPPAVLAAAAALAATRELAPDAAEQALEALSGKDVAAQRKVAAFADRIAALCKSTPGVPVLAELERRRLAVRDEASDPTSAAFRSAEAEVADADDAQRRERLREQAEARKKRAERLLGLDPSPAEKRSRAEAELDESNENSPVRKRLNLMA